MGAATSKSSASAVVESIQDHKKNVKILIVYRSDNDHMKYHARKLCEMMPNAVEHAVDVIYFPCGNPQVVISDPDIKPELVISLLDWSCEGQYSGFVELVIAKSIAKKPWCSKLVVIPPFFAESTCDREVQLDPEGHKEVPYGIAFAEIYSTVLDNATFVMVDLHAMQMEYYFTRNHCVQIKAEGMRYLLTQTRRAKNDARTRVVFADEGALKRFEATLRQEMPDCKVSYCVKRKVSSDQRTCTIHHVDAVEANMAEERVIVIDDIIRSGKSLTDCVNECVACGAKDIHVLATHGVFPKDSFVQFMKDNKGAVASCSLTDTHRNASRAAEYAPEFYTVYPMAPVFADIVNKK